MPKYTGNSLEVDRITITEQADVVKEVASDGYYFNTARVRYQRIHSHECPFILDPGLVLGHPSATDGFPASVVMTSSGEKVRYFAYPKVPLGCRLDTTFVLYRNPGTETGTDSLVVRTLNIGGDTQLSGFTIAHSNNVTAYAGRLINHTDVQITADPASATDFTWYQIEYKQEYDATAGGGQSHVFWGFILKYTLLTSTQLREST